MRSGAARREVRQAKKAVARAESGRKKGKRVAGSGKSVAGGLSKKIKKRGAGRGPALASAAPAAAKNSKKPAEESESEEEAEGFEARFTAAEKKLRALEKKHRHVKTLKVLLARGVELDAQQQAKLRAEKSLKLQIEQMMHEVAAENERAAAAEEEEPQEEAMAVVTGGRAILRGSGPAPVAVQPQAKPSATSIPLRQPVARSAEPVAPPIDMSSMGKLELKRHLKKLKQKERLLAKQAVIEDKEHREVERRRARIALSSVPQPATSLGVGTKRARPS